MNRRLLDGFGRDARHAVRSLSRNPGLLVVSAVSLGLGIGLNAMLFVAISTIYWHDPTAREAAHVVAVDPGNANQFSYPDYEDLRRSGIFESVAGFRTASMNLGVAPDVTRTGVMVVTAEFFETLGIDAVSGRTFEAAEATPARAPRLAVVTAGFARTHLTSGAAGGTIVLDGEPFDVVGILPDDYRAVTGWMGPPIYVPASRLTLPSLDARGSPSLTLFGRLHPGTGATGARDKVTQLAADLARTYPDRLPARRPADVFPLNELQFRGTPAQFSLLAAVTWITAGLVLLIACVNVTGLLLARGADRRRELAIRAALGATRTHIVRATMTESLLLVLAGAAIGLPLAFLLAQAPLASGMGALQDAMRPDLRLLPFAAAVVALATCLCGVLPALRASRADLLAGIRHGGEAATPRTRLRQALLAAQVAMSFVLVVAAFLCVRSQALVARADPGFDLDHGVVARIGLEPARSPEARARLAEQLVDRLAAMPGIESVSVADVVPLGGDVLVRSFHPAGRSDIPGTRPDTYSVGPDYFRTLGIPLVRGRAFTAADRAGTPAAAIVNETFARTYFPGRDAVGERVQTVDDPEAEVIGVAADYRIGTIGEAPASVIYYAYAQRPSALNIHLRAAGPPDGLLPAIRRAIVEVEGTVPVSVQTLRAATSLEFTMRRTGTWLMSVLGGVGLLLAVVGIYGVLAHAAAARTIEVGVRMALGASPRDIRREMLVRAGATVVPGVALGILASLVLLPAFGTFLAGVSPYDPVAMVSGAGVMVAVGLAAGMRPAWRLARVDPARALRRL